MNRSEKAKLYQETVEINSNGHYTSPNGNDISVNELNDYMMENTKFYKEKCNPNIGCITRHETEIKVVDNDCLYEAKKLLDEGLKVAVLNMASWKTPGGFVIGGSSAQEENLFRRTNLFKSLYQFHNIGREYNVPQRENERYPLNLRYGGIYTPKAIVFRESDDKDYKLMEEPFYVDVISLAAVQKPKMENGYIVPEVEKIIKTKIKQILNIAIENGNDALILSAFGCGAYKTPPSQMARFFADVLASEEYQGAFKKIHFAIINVEGTNGEHNKQEGNFIPFKRVFG